MNRAEPNTLIPKLKSLHTTQSESEEERILREWRRCRLQEKAFCPLDELSSHRLWRFSSQFSPFLYQASSSSSPYYELKNGQEEAENEEERLQWK